VISVGCPDPLPRPISVGIMVDTYRFIDIARKGSERFVNHLNMPLNEVGITFMDRRPLVYQDFTDDKTKALQKSKTIPEAPGYTQVEKMFFDEYAGGINLIKTRESQNRVLIYISDLHCPNLTVDEQKLFNEANQNNIRIYTLLLGTNDYSGLFGRIAKQTNGLVFENVKNDNIEYIFDRIAYREQNDPCEIYWENNSKCNQVIDFNVLNKSLSLETKFTYRVNEDQTVKLNFNNNFINYGERNIGEVKDTTITITAIRSDQKIVNVSFEPDFGYFKIINNLPIILNLGDQVDLKIQYSVNDTARQYTRMNVFSEYCKSSIGLLTGGKYQTIVNKTLEITQPNGKELFVAGTDTTIIWDGVTKNNLVTCNFSGDNGKSWKLINYYASGLNLNWKVPIVESDSCLIKISQLDNTDKFKRIQWSRISGEKLNDEVRSIISSNNGGSISVGTYGQSLNNNAPIGLFYILKLNDSGEEEWSKTIGGTKEDIANSIIELKNGDYIIVGYSKSRNGDFRFNNNNSSWDDFAIIKINKSGDIIWSKLYGGDGTDEARCVIETEDKSYIVGGFSKSNDADVKINNGNKDGWFIKLSEDGNLLWSKVYGGSEDDEIRSIRKTKDGNYIVAGSSKSSDKDVLLNKGYYDFWLLKLSSNGEIIWSKTYGGSMDDVAYDIVQNFDSTYFVTGYTYSNDGDVQINSGGKDIWLLKLNSEGDILWSKTFGGSSHDEGHSLIISIEGGILIGGYTESKDGDVDENSGLRDMWLLKINIEGELEWSRTYSNNSKETANSIVQDYDGSYLIGGSLENSDSLDKQAVVLKVSPPPLSLQSDTSDAVFSIIMPRPVIQNNDIDMGLMIVGGTKDTIVSSVICNVGDAPLHVLGIEISDAHDSGDFLIPRGAGDFYLERDSCKDIMFEFTPSKAGYRYAIATIKTTVGDFKDTIHLLGGGINPRIEPITEVVDFGKIKIGLSKDTTVFIIENKSNQDINITNTSIIGPDMDQFEILSTDIAFTIPANEKKDLKLRFLAQNTGRASTRIEFEYDGAITPLRTMLFAEGISDVVQTVSDTIDFGNIKIGNSRDTNAYIIKNISRNSIEITDLRIKGPDMNQFSIQEPGTDFKIESYDSLQVKLRFTANTPGGASTTLESYNYLTSTTLETILVGKGVGGNIQPSMKDAFIGENSNLELHIDGINPSLLLNIATNFSATVSYNSTLLAPIDKSIQVTTEDNKSFITIAGELSGVPQIATVPMKVGLGTADRSGLVITEFQLYDANGDSVDYDIEPGVGEFNVLGICEEGGKRLINPNGEAVDMVVTTDGLTSYARINITLIETGQTDLVLFDQIGNMIEKVYSGTPSTGSQEINLDLSKYASGRYYIKLTTPTITKTEIIEVVR
jgi:hypothetical protein